eukprot:TRINITY_DN377_c0_g1_i1.p1 TRINITY_DN377_c0_g1~~TRINITY_DN377_c0_g1_i1.p1  ORF type:complete len:646 (-),score=159.16 TRINITY_DN377_c0_g1_i1:47-1984(-)
MKCNVVLLLLVVLGVAFVYGDVYMHNPRGNNNRLNEANTNRDNNNRLFDSQNNAKGGYCWGPPMYFYAGSRLSVEWTNQHGCGNPNTHCEVIIQYMCQDQVTKQTLGWNSWDIRDGVTTGTPAADNNTVNNLTPDVATFARKGPNSFDPATASNVIDPNRPLSGVESKRVCISTSPSGQCLTYEDGMNEPFEHYDACRRRARNKGLFLADQQLGGQTAIFTRQNPGGGRSGLECPEERDYYPYWHPTPWVDVAVLTDNVARCPYYTESSQNNNIVNYCTIAEYNNENDCTTNGGSWNFFTHYANAPDCAATPATRDNHLGNDQTGYASSYNWTLPDIDNNQCVLRVRYNISTADYDGWGTYSDANADRSRNKSALISNNPYIQPFGDGQELRLAINTAQFGRTFQDRSYVFGIIKRPDSVGKLDRIWNLNVRGKRGNIVQTYPAVEYDFVPNRLAVRVGDYIHFQWTGCDTNPAGNDGEGTQSTDRSNIVFLKGGKDHNKNGDQTFFSRDAAQGHAFLGNDPQQCATDLAALRASTNDQNTINRDPKNCAKLNAASRYFDGGLVKITDHHNGNTYHYMSTRNNNFTNRSQKGTITIIPFLPVWAIVLVVVSAAIMLLSLVALGFGIWSRFNPDGRVAKVFKKTPF